MMGWQPIATAPEGKHILLYWEHGERGNGGIEAGTIYRLDDGTWDTCYWTHGGPNAGSDIEFPNGECPSRWQPLPDPPFTVIAAERG